jgi:hypothetical protein
MLKTHKNILLVSFFAQTSRVGALFDEQALFEQTPIAVSANGGIRHKQS